MKTQKYEKGPKVGCWPLAVGFLAFGYWLKE
jgi:hypothetical protein